MKEHSPASSQIDKSNHQWVPFRLSDSWECRQVTYDLISWDPRFITNSKDILIDINQTNKYLKRLGVTTPIEIKPLTSKPKDIYDVTTGSVQNEQITLTAIKKKTKTKPETIAQVSQDKITQKMNIQINFDGIDHYIRENNPSADEKKLNRLYGKMIDRALKSQSATITIFEYFNLILKKENYHLLEESFRAAKDLFIMTIANGVLIATVPNTEKPMIFPLACLILPVFYFLENSAFILTTSLEDSLYDEKKSKKLDYLFENLANLFFPVSLYKNLIYPLMSTIHPKPLIKGKE